MNIAIIGCGLVGNKRAENLSKHHKIIAVCDKYKKNAKKILKKNKYATFYFKWKDVFKISDLDCVIICTPHNLLFKITSFGLKLNKIHLFVEKPGVKNLKEIENLIKIYRSLKKSKISIRFGFNHRFYKSITLAKKLIKGDEIGSLLYLRGVYGHGGKKNYSKEWRGLKNQSGGGQLIDQGIHLIDLSRFFLGKLNVQSSYFDNMFWNTKVEDNIFMTLKYKKKIAFLHASWTEWKNKFYLEIFGKKGKIEISGKGGSYGAEKVTIFKMHKKQIKPNKKIINFSNNDLSWKYELNLFFKDIEKTNDTFFHLKNLYENFKIINTIYKK